MKWILACFIGCIGGQWCQAHPEPTYLLRILDRRLERSPGNAALLRSKAELLIRSGHPEKAGPVVAEAMASAQGDPRSLLLQCRLSNALGEREMALSQAIEITERYLDFADGWGELAQLHRESENLDAAIAAKFQQLHLSETIGSADFLICAEWLTQRAHSGDFEKAIRVLDQAIERFGSVVRLQENAIELECLLGRYDGALRRVDVLVAKYRPSVALSMTRAGILERAGRFEEAAAACDSALALFSLEKQSSDGGLELESLYSDLAQRKATNLRRSIDSK